MFSRIEDAVAWVTARRNRGTGFAHFQEVMAAAGNPQDSFRSVHVAGTNGKGSTCNDICSLLRACGYSVGLYTSPHLINHRDRIRLDGEWIGAQEFLQYLNSDLALIEREDLSMFEIDTLIASQWYRDCRADWAVIETGLGGRLDSTNCLHHPQLEVITTIGFDHMDRLGNTLGAIAFEKAGIIKPDSRVLIGRLDPEAEQVIARRAADMHAELRISSYEDLGPQAIGVAGERFELGEVPGYQKGNAALALQAVAWLGLDLHDPRLHEAIRTSRWAGRYEQVGDHPRVILDGAHNPEGMAALTAAMKDLPHPRIAVFSALKDKQGAKMRQMLEQAADRVLITQFDNARADTAEHLAGGKDPIIADWQQAVREALTLAGPEGSVVITGSLYLISLVRPGLVSDSEAA